MQKHICTLVKKSSVLLVSAVLTAQIPNAFACNTVAECNVEGKFNRAIELDLQRSYAPAQNSPRDSSSSYDGVSSALANSFKSWEDSKNAAWDVSHARYLAWEKEELSKPRTFFSEADIANDRRNVLIFGAEDGRAMRQNQLGLSLLNGTNGFQVDVGKGMYWLRKAATQGDHHALRNLANILIAGDYGVKPEPEVGLQLYELYMSASGLSASDQASFLLNKAVEIYKKDDRFYPQLIEAAFKANTLGVAHAPQVIYKLSVVSEPSTTDLKLKTLLETPSSNLYLVAASAYATEKGIFGMTKDKVKGREIIQAEAALGHQPAIDYLQLIKCLNETKTLEDRQACEPLVHPFFL
ncbi:MAG: sel1 repeat family protein [Gallionella sp.]|nr:sel1 repeat family protein [Gallionella sp.]